MFSDRVTRTLFTLGELTLADPQYTGPFFDLDKIAKDVNDKVIVKETMKKDTQHFWAHDAQVSLLMIRGHKKLLILI